MSTMSIADFKAQFSEVIEIVEKGEEVIVTKGKNRKPVGAFVPMDRIRPKKRVIGILQGKSSVKFANDFKMTTEELLEMCDDDDPS